MFEPVSYLFASKLNRDEPNWGNIFRLFKESVLSVGMKTIEKIWRQTEDIRIVNSLLMAVPCETLETMLGE